MISRLDGVAPRGEKIASAEARKVDNFTRRLLDQYVRSFVFRGEDLVKGRIIYVTLYDLHEVTGEIKQKVKCYYSDIEGFGPAYYYVVVGKREYLVPEDTYIKLKVGQTAIFEAAGPIEETCDCVECSTYLH